MVLWQELKRSRSVQTEWIMEMTLMMHWDTVSYTEDFCDVFFNEFSNIKCLKNTVSKYDLTGINCPFF